MALLDKNSILDLDGLPGPLFDLGMTSTLQQDSLPLIPTTSTYQDLDGAPGPSFDIGDNSTLHEDSLTQQFTYQHGNSTATVGPSTQDIDGNDGGQGYFHGISNPGKGQGIQVNGKDLHVHLLNDTITYVNGGFYEDVGPSPGPTGNSEYQDLDGEDGPSFDLGHDSNIQTDSLLNVYNYSHGGVPGQGGPVPKTAEPGYTSVGADLNTTFDGIGDAVIFNMGKEARQDPANPIFDTIHEKSLQMVPRTSGGPTSRPIWASPDDDAPLDLDLNGKTPSSWSTAYSDTRHLSQLNQVPGGMSPSAYADINGTTGIDPRAPHGAPIPDPDGYFARIDTPTKYNGLQIKKIDLHEHLLQNPYTYSHGLSTVTIKPSTSDGDAFTYQDLDLDIRDETPTQYIAKLPK